MKRISCLVALFLTFSALASSVPEERMVMNALKDTLCPEPFQPTYRFVEINRFSSYVLKDGKLVLNEGISQSCPEGMHYNGSFCVELLCTKDSLPSNVEK